MVPQRKIFGGLGNQMFRHAYLVGKVFDGELPDVYVQQTHHWSKYAHVIKQLFSQGIGPTLDTVSLHIRRGDYVNNDYYVDLWETDYYKKAIAMFPEDKFIVFCRDNQGWETDKADRQWCRDNLTPLLGDRWELAPKENSETDDMNLMASCKSNIMANSSFSWWAAYLNPNPDKTVVAPKEWFTNKNMRMELLPEWIQI